MISGFGVTSQMYTAALCKRNDRHDARMDWTSAPVGTREMHPPLAAAHNSAGTAVRARKARIKALRWLSGNKGEGGS
ncbi:hypothetical protein DL766_002648 [Monosporascus sp. MC13-8B]|uniref:Uncharacterized protein n=1 Tax=Monosporascus cannonballus TaxID=155416 RepID=A0ABY0HBP6_9PEZI|nr:hypothetical protein DL762_003042 [Monosporascus cannonballus]RYP35201.1 hypothetical protein DL766_002648 [Monosporascus sp. MC13-8B]